MSNKIYIFATKGTQGIHVTSLKAFSSLEDACKFGGNYWNYIYELEIDGNSAPNLISRKEREEVLRKALGQII